MSTIEVEYIGTKARKDDNVAGTGVTWFGHGDVQSVPATAWGILSKHPQVWRRAGGESVQGHIAGVVSEDGTVANLADMPPAELKQLAQDMGLPADGKSPAELAEAIGSEPVDAVASEELPAPETEPAAEHAPATPRKRRAGGAQ